jgi:branched-chain amino acid transport system permease protein
MLRTAAGQRKLLAFVLLAFFLVYWIPFSNAFPGWVPVQFGSYRIFQATTIAMWAIVALGLNILTGYNGQISLGHGAFVALGGYTSAILIFDHNWPFWATIPIAGLLTGAIGFLVGLPALRLTGPYLAVATLALALATPQIIGKYDNLTHGAQGISIPPLTTPGALDSIMNDTQYVYFVAILVAAIMAFIAWNIVRSRLGRAFIAIRDSEIAAQAMGISVPRFKTMAFAISAFYAGVCGGLYIQVVNFVSPQSFEVIQSINYLTTIVVGGLASILGSILGAAVFVLVPEINPHINNLLETFHLPTAETASDVLFGTSLILVMIFMPYGFAGFARRLTRLQPPLVMGSISNFFEQVGLKVRTIRSGPGGDTGEGPAGRSEQRRPDASDEEKGDGSP